MQAKYLLAQMALQDVDRFYATFGASGDTEYLPKLWTAIGHQFPPDQRVASDGLTTFRSDSDGVVDHIVICFPTPQRRNEAHFVAVIKLAHQTRVFCLEKSENSMTGHETTVVSELAKHGRVNWGDGCEPNADQFVDHINALIGDPGARPVSFIPVKLA
jgi:hypothetical protein